LYGYLLRLLQYCIVWLLMLVMLVMLSLYGQIHHSL